MLGLSGRALEPRTSGRCGRTRCTGLSSVPSGAVATPTVHPSPRLCEALFDAAPDALLAVDEDGRICFSNAQAEKLLGFSRDAHARPMGVELELWALHKDGREIPVEISLSPVEAEQGILVAAAIRDVSYRRAAERAIRESEERFRLMVDGVREYALFMLDAGGGGCRRAREDLAACSADRSQRRRGMAPSEGRESLLGDGRHDGAVRRATPAAWLRQARSRSDRASGECCAIARGRCDGCARSSTPPGRVAERGRGVLRASARWQHHLRPGERRAGAG